MEDSTKRMLDEIEKSSKEHEANVRNRHKKTTEIWMVRQWGGRCQEENEGCGCCKARKAFDFIFGAV